MSSQPLTSSQFGASEFEFGKRLEYKKPKYRDVVFAILYYIHLLIVIAAGAYLWIVKYPDIDNDDNDDWQSDISLTGIFCGIGLCLIAGIVFGLFWLEIMKRFASKIIKSMLFLNVAMWCLVAVVGLITMQIVLMIIGGIFALIYVLYTWCVWKRIPFSSALLSVSSSITSSYGGTVFLSLSVILFDILWLIIWGCCCSAYFIVESQPSNGVIFLLLVSLYWGFQVNQNISHTTTCGVTAAWYFATDSDHNTNPKATAAAFKRTMTTSFGSVCLGSLIVAILQAIRAMIRSAQNNKHNLLKCIALCLLACIERMVRYFNKYAYAQCAIYGVSFLTAASRTFDLFAKRGILALINDDLTGLAIFAGALIGAIISAAIGYFVGYLFYNGSSDHDIRVGVPIALATYGFFIGLILTSTVLYVVHSSIICLFVCYSEDPAALNQNRPEEYHRITAAKPEFAQVFSSYGKGSSGPQQAPQQSGHIINDGDKNKFAV